MKIFLKKENKKTAIVCFGMRISLDSTNVRSIDLIYLREYLQNVLGRKCDFVSRKTAKDNDRDYFKDIANTDLNDYDEVWIYNAALNLFGGVFSLDSIQTFEKVCDFKGDIFYFLVDPKMPCRNYAQFIKQRMDEQDCVPVIISGKKTPYHIDPAKIEKYTNEIWPKIKTAFGGSDYEKYLKLYNEINDRTISKSESHINRICDCDWCFIDLFEYYAVNEQLDLKMKDYDMSFKAHDLIYFGNNRHTSRGKLIERLYDNANFKVFIAGYDPEFKHAFTEVNSYVEHDKLFPLICTSYATVVCGDELHNGNIRTPRFFEAMMLDTVGLIHNSFDPEHKYIKNKELADFIYIETTEDIEDRLNKIKNDEGLYRKIVAAERKEILDQFGHYEIEKQKETNKEKTPIAESLF